MVYFKIDIESSDLSFSSCSNDKPFNSQEDIGVPFHRNFNSTLKGDNKKKISCERRAYESVDE